MVNGQNFDETIVPRPDSLHNALEGSPGDGNTIVAPSGSAGVDGILEPATITAESLGMYTTGGFAEYDFGKYSPELKIDPSDEVNSKRLTVARGAIESLSGKPFTPYFAGFLPALKDLHGLFQSTISLVEEMGSALIAGYDVPSKTNFRIGKEQEYADDPSDAAQNLHSVYSAINQKADELLGWITQSTGLEIVKVEEGANNGPVVIVDIEENVYQEGDEPAAPAIFVEADKPAEYLTEILNEVVQYFYMSKANNVTLTRAQLERIRADLPEEIKNYAAFVSALLVNPICFGVKEPRQEAA